MFSHFYLRRLTCTWVCAVGVFACSAHGEDEVFSGPQVGEKLPGLQVQVLASKSGDRSEVQESQSEVCDPVADAGDGPVMLVFLHELTRPGFGLARAVANFAAERSEQKIKTSVIFLTDDLTATRKRASGISQHFSADVTYGISPDGKEGPGAYGLNRNVTLTVLVGDEGKVTENFALVQPQLQADGPKILEAIVAVTGGGDVPDVADLAPSYARRMQAERMQQAGRGRGAEGRDASGRGAQDARLTSLLRSVINKQATPEEVQSAAKKVEAYVEENAAAKKELARIVHTVVNSGRISNYGSVTAQQVLRRWMKGYPHQTKPRVED